MENEQTYTYGGMPYDQAREWLYTEGNAYQCEHCPENRGERNGLPCGQQNCWVCVHCHPEQYKW